MEVEDHQLNSNLVMYEFVWLYRICHLYYSLDTLDLHLTFYIPALPGQSLLFLPSAAPSSPSTLSSSSFS